MIIFILLLASIIGVLKIIAVYTFVNYIMCKEFIPIDFWHVFYGWLTLLFISSKTEFKV